jgi:membrane dipeptidase
MGIDHVALGSDFDGISVLPRPLKDVTSLPELVRALGARGYSDDDVRKILGENFLRVLASGP